eukprot:TRINITY_DN59689_c0_g1_i1.p1 TRINITY_DN59689_c0_g1~~TRINITY_DN59689_c0_g1_i1.p1  ORF type:complete len:291 (-),score=59.33 TRINITY_DN59689_c0_g1_i1:31-903(-)
MPIMGLGTGGIMEIRNVTVRAIKHGYRLLNTGENYGNNAEIREALQESTVPREQIWLTTKVCPTNFGMDRTSKSVRGSLNSLGTSWVDLYLVHWPRCTQSEYSDCSAVAASGATWHHSWRALERAYAEGTALAIGVSNWDSALMAELLGLATVTPHAVEQLLNLAERDGGMVELCRQNEIAYTAYGSLRNLMDQYFRDALMSQDEIRVHDQAQALTREITDKRGVSFAALVLRWQIQLGMFVIPRATQDKNMVANLQVLEPGFNLTEQEMDALNGIGGYNLEKDLRYRDL